MTEPVPPTLGARLALAIPDFVYRAAMDGGPVEHELCPVVVAEVDADPVPDVAEVDADPVPDPAEVDGVEWTTWEAVRARAADEPGSLSPWSVRQIGQLAALAPDPLAWLDAEVGGGRPGGVPGRAVVVAGDGADPALDRPAGIGVVPAAPTPESDPDPVAAVRDAVEQVIDRFLAARGAEAAALHPAIGQVSGEVRRLVAAGGKRLRPAFAYWGHLATGAPHDDGVVEAAAALELLHTFALLHDDVMDRSARRRGRPTAHRALAEGHRADGLDGDDAWFGVSGAVLAGDLAFLWSTRLLDGAALDAGARHRGREVFGLPCTEVIGGQYLDLRLTHGDGHDRADTAGTGGAPG
jgi:hypothetical protein